MFLRGHHAARRGRDRARLPRRGGRRPRASSAAPSSSASASWPRAAAPLTVACTQEAPLFSELAGEAAARSRFANIRETAGWSSDAAKAGPKMAALLAAAAEPLPDIPVRQRSTSEGVMLIYGRDEHAIEAAQAARRTISTSPC